MLQVLIHRAHPRVSCSITFLNIIEVNVKGKISQTRPSQTLMDYVTEWHQLKHIQTWKQISNRYLQYEDAIRR